MKLNWGKSIAIVMLCFMAFIITLTTKMMSRATDLEQEDYYAREVNYEQEIQAQLNAQKADIVSINSEADYFVVIVNQDYKIEDLKIELNRPNNKELDKQFTFKEGNVFTIDKDELHSGLYKIAISYNYDGQTCLIKDEIHN